MTGSPKTTFFDYPSLTSLDACSARDIFGSSRVCDRMPCQQLSSHGACEIIKVEDQMMLRHLQRKKVSANSQMVTTILRCVQALRAQKDALPAFGPIRATHKAKEALRMLSGKDGRSFLAGRRMSASRVKGKEKVGFQCSSVLVRSGLSRASCFVV